MHVTIINKSQETYFSLILKRGKIKTVLCFMLKIIFISKNIEN